MCDVVGHAGFWASTISYISFRFCFLIEPPPRAGWLAVAEVLNLSKLRCRGKDLARIKALGFRANLYP